MNIVFSVCLLKKLVQNKGQAINYVGSGIGGSETFGDKLIDYRYRMKLKEELREKVKERHPPHSRKVSNVAKLIMVMNAMSKGAGNQPQRKHSSMLDLMKNLAVRDENEDGLKTTSVKIMAKGIGKKEREDFQTEVKFLHSSTIKQTVITEDSNDDLDGLLEERQSSSHMDERKKKLLRLKFNKLPFVLR